MVALIGVFLLVQLLAVAGCAVEWTIADRLVRTDRGGVLEADANALWRRDMMLDAMHTVTVSDGTQIACFVMEPWAYSMMRPQDFPKNASKQAVLDALKSAAKVKAAAWETDRIKGMARRFNQWIEADRVSSFDYFMIMPAKPSEQEADESFFQPPPLKGTVVLLQGWRTSVLSVPYLRPLACSLSNAGYRVIMPDVRGQGASGGRYPGFGAGDRQDLAEVVTALSSRGVVEGPLFSVGHSYGGMLAILWGATDPRVERVVALSPLHDARLAFPHAIRGLAKQAKPKGAWILDTFVSDQMLRAGFDRAGQLSGIDLSRANAIDAIGGSRAPVLLIHGLDDAVCDPDWTRRIYAGRESDTQVMMLPGHDHWSFLHGSGPLEGTVMAWLAEQNGGADEQVLQDEGR